jgi:hypothetical protein
MSLLLWVAVAHAGEVDGFAELRVQAYAGVDADVPLFVVERLRPTFSGELSDRVVLTTTIEAGLGQGWTVQRGMENLIDQEGLSPLILDALGVEETENDALRVSADEDYLAVDRLHVELLLKHADIRIGRQALNWGSGFVVNPSDPFPEVLLTEPWKPRSGMNAVRVDVPIGDLNGAQLVVGSDDAFTHPRLAGRLTANWLETDWSLVSAWREEVDETIVGADIKGTLGVGFWFEGVAHIPQDGPATEELVVGLDYSFPVLQQLIVTGQYYRNGAGADDPVSADLFAERTAFAPAFSGRDYAIASVVAGLTRDVSTSMLWMQNLGDATAFAVPSLATVIRDNFEVSLAAQLPIAFSDGGEFKPRADDLVVVLPTEESTLKEVDLGTVVPDATIIVWSRVNF